MGILCWGYIGIVEEKMETTFSGLEFRVSGVGGEGQLWRGYCPNNGESNGKTWKMIRSLGGNLGAHEGAVRLISLELRVG